MPWPWTRYLTVNVRVYFSLTPRGFQRRARFQPNLFHRENPREVAKRKKHPQPTTPVNAATTRRSSEPSETANYHRRPGHDTRSSSGTSVRRLSSQEQHWVTAVSRRTPSDSDALSPERQEPSQTLPDDFPAVQEVWFAGCHSDVGGGAVEDTVRYSLGEISLRWMVKQVVLSQCEIKFDAAALRRADIDILTTDLADPTQETVGQICRWVSEAETVTAPSALLTPSEGEGSGEDMIWKGGGEGAEAKTWPREPDVLADIHDELGSKLSGYWLLEYFPATFGWQRVDGEWKFKRKYELSNTTLPNGHQLIYVETNS